MKIAVVSDTHGLLRPEVISKVRSCDVCLHAGDFHTKEIYDRLRKEGSLHAVKGNNDGEWAAALPLSIQIQLGGLHIYMAHNKADIPKVLTDIDIVVFGHSHQYVQEMRGETLWLNPGSCGKKRFRLPLTMAVLHVDGGTYFIEKISFDKETSGC